MKVSEAGGIKKPLFFFSHEKALIFFFKNMIKKNEMRFYILNSQINNCILCHGCGGFAYGI